MALSLSPAVQAALSAGQGALAALYTFEFGSGTYGFWTGLGAKIHNGVTYHASGSVIEVSAIEQRNDGSVSELTISLAAAPDKGITPDVLEALYDEDWHLKPVTVQIAILDPDSYAIIGTQTLFRGIVDSAPYQRQPEARIEARCQSRAIDLTRPGNLYRNASTQKRFDATDRGLEGIGALNATLQRGIKWGQA
jgi:hypothetical protein